VGGAGELGAVFAAIDEILGSGAWKRWEGAEILVT
jgi:hypothetical protein